MRKIYIGMILVLVSGQFGLVFAQNKEKDSDPDAALRSKKLEFDDQAVQAFGSDYGKLDLIQVKDEGVSGGKLYQVRKDFIPETNREVKSWGVLNE